MGRKLRDKIPRVEVNESRINDAEWKQLLKERGARRKLRQKQYADKKRAVQNSNITEDDRVLLKQTRRNKLGTDFEPHPYKVVRREGNAVVIQDSDGDNKMRAIAHMKKYVEPQVVETLETTETTVVPDEPGESATQPASVDPVEQAKSEVINSPPNI
jgi:hypothetical protein